MCIKVNRKMFDINVDIIPDSLIFMLQAYHAGNFEKFGFWRRQFERAVKVECGECDCGEMVINV